MRIVSLFSGAGGLDLGMIRAGNDQCGAQVYSCDGKDVRGR